MIFKKVIYMLEKNEGIFFNPTHTNLTSDWFQNWYNEVLLRGYYSQLTNSFSILINPIHLISLNTR